MLTENPPILRMRERLEKSLLRTLSLEAQRPRSSSKSKLEFLGFDWVPGSTWMLEEGLRDYPPLRSTPGPSISE